MTRKAFTLLEVMISVVIISVVIMALLKMHANSTYLFENINKTKEMNQYLSLFVANSDYGFEKKSITLDQLVKDFSLDDDLRDKLKEIKSEIKYTQLEKLDLGDVDTMGKLQSQENIDDVNKTTVNFIFYKILI